MKILVLNCGSSSIKYKFYDMDGERVLAQGGVERIGLDEAFIKVKLADGSKKQIMADLLAAADALAERLILPRDAGKYLSGFAREVATRAEALRDCGGLRGVFV